MKEKIFNIFLYIILIFLSIIILVVFYFKNIKNEKVISIFGNSFFIVETGSMEPTIKTGELIVVSKSKNYNKNDIITVIDSENYIYTHRIVDVKDNLITTKGDNNDLNDEAVEFKFVIGKVIFHSQILGFFIIYILKPIIILNLIFISISLIKNFIKKEVNANEEEHNN